MKIYHFYHIWADGKWRVPLKEHLKFLIESQLINNISSFQVGIVGKRNNRLRVKEYLMDHKIKFEICNESEDGFENETLDKILDLKEDDGYVLYAHTKGSYNDLEWEHHWRRFMSFNLIKDWKKCVKLLEDHAAVGNSYSVPNLSFLFTGLDNSYPECTVIFSKGPITFPYGCFYGNFWWSHLKYVKLLGKVPKIFKEDGSYFRGSAEKWLINLRNVVTDKEFSVYQLSENEPSLETIVTDKVIIKDIIGQLLEDGTIGTEDHIHIHFDENKLNKSIISINVSGTKNHDGNKMYSFVPKFYKNFNFTNQYKIVE
jgi:hypothetical protein